MITTKIGETKLEGSKSELHADISCIIHAAKSGGLSEEEIRRAVDIGLMNEKERDEYFRKILGERLGNPLCSVLKDLARAVLDVTEEPKKPEA